MSRDEYVQYGCGWSFAEEWRNFDSSLTLRFERVPFFGKMYTKNSRRFPDQVEYGNIITGLPIGEGVCKAVYCSHVLEHLSLTDFRVALANTYRILRSGGVFRLVMPDLRYYAERYLSDETPGAAVKFLTETDIGLVSRPHSLSTLISSLLGGGKHLWLWDYESTAAELAAVGFSNIRSADYGDSSEPRFLEVENKERWGVGCVGIECIK